MNQQHGILIRNLVIALSGLVGGAVLLPLSTQTLAANPSTNFEQQAVEARIKPIGQVKVGSAATTPAAAPTAPAVPKSAKEVFAATCTVCHTAGVAGAPKLGNKDDWAPRIGKGTEALMNSVIKGLNAMPPRAGNPDLTDAEIKATVEYMLAEVGVGAVPTTEAVPTKPAN